MKSTGVVRRIDELGRIVIPKEIRRNLGIHDGENVEIFTDSDSIILKKHYRMRSNLELASSLCELIYNNFNYEVIITDREKIISTAGFTDEIINKKLTIEFLNIIENRETIEKTEYSFNLEDINIQGNFIFIPIISLNDSIGLVIIKYTNESNAPVSIGKLIASIFAKKLDI